MVAKRVVTASGLALPTVVLTPDRPAGETTWWPYLGINRNPQYVSNLVPLNRMTNRSGLARQWHPAADVGWPDGGAENQRVGGVRSVEGFCDGRLGLCEEASIFRNATMDSILGRGSAPTGRLRAALLRWDTVAVRSVFEWTLYEKSRLRLFPSMSTAECCWTLDMCGGNRPSSRMPMRRTRTLLVCAALAATIGHIAFGGVSGQPDWAWLGPCNVVWDSPSKDSLGSMPLGNGDIGLNVWVEEGGDLRFYISKADALDGNHVNRKLGSVRIAIKPNPFAVGLPFHQTLDLQNARIVVQAGKPGEAVSLEVWVDANHPSIHVLGRSDVPIEAQVSVESIRAQRQVESLASAYAQPGPPDVLLADKADRLLWCFRNESSSWSARLTGEGSGKLANKVKDPLLHRTFGAIARGPCLVRQSPNALATVAKSNTLDLSIDVLNDQTDTIEQWQAQLDKQAATTGNLDRAETWKAHCQWWCNFWHRSRIVVGGCEQAKTITRGYALERFVQACASRGGFPLLYNGSIFTMDMPAGTYAFCGPRGGAVNADYRDWECLPIMWQNTRLPYWSMIARGDFDLMRPVFQAVFDALEVSKSRSQAWFKHDGAVMTEAMLWKGVSALYPVPQHLQYHFTSNVEMPSMMCDYYAHTQDRQFLREILLPCADSFVTFFEKHFPQRNARGKMVISPAGAVETYQPVTNPVTEVCGLRYLLGKLSAMDEELIGKDRKEHWRKLLDELPPVPTRVIKGQTLLAPGEKYSGRLICETPELYAVYPFRQATLWNPDLLAVGRQSFAVRQLSLDGTPDTQSWQTGGWVQSPMQAAYLGLPKAAAKLVGLNFADKFPWFGDNRFGDNGNTPATSAGPPAHGSPRSGKPRWITRPTTTTGPTAPMACRAWYCRPTTGKSMCCPPGRRIGTSSSSCMRRIRLP